MSIPDKYYIKEISHQIAFKVIIEKHYLHRRCPCTFSFGLFETDTNELVGCVIYGTPSSAPLRRGICGDNEKNNVIELTRLWIDDKVPKNSESYLISHTIPLVNKEIIVSFADSSQGHVGYVYQATNWYYTGLSAKRTNWTIEGMDKHCQTIADKYTSKELKKLYGKKFTLVDRPRKHRYVYFNCSKTRRRMLLKKLNYKIEPYPKILKEEIKNG
jgi:hypothetical protein